MAALTVAAMGATVATAVTVPTIAGAQPFADPAPRSPQTIDDIQKALGKLALKNVQLVEQFDQARNDVHARQAEAAQAGKDAEAAQTRVDTARTTLGASAAAMYEGGSFSATGALLNSDSGASYLDQLGTLRMLDTHNAQVVTSFRASQRSAQQARAQASDLLAQAQVKLSELSARRDAVSAHIDKYKALLSTLSAQQRAAFQNAQGAPVSSARVASARTTLKLTHGTPAAARTAVEFALAQVGKPYVWGAAGPSSYDCSGLTMAAYHAAGISLPHSAAAQFGYGRHVGFNQLQPGDLLFFYQPIGHVSIYIGDGLMVSAPQTGENVKVIPATTFGSSYTGATRLVG